MVTIARLGNPSNPESIPVAWRSFFFADVFPDLINYQDGCHLMVKLFRRLFNNVIFGNFFASINFFHIMLENMPKDRHLLTVSDFKSDGDKMNVEVVKKCLKSDVFHCLQDIPNSNGLILYLKVIKSIQRAFVDYDSTVKERICNAFLALFILRYWRLDNMKSGKQNDTGLEKNLSNFISDNAYVGIELNCHSLLNNFLYCQKRNRPDLFIISLFSSQMAESLFRRTRSMSSTFFTYVNFDLFEFCHKIKRSVVITKLINELKGLYTLPREDLKTEHYVPETLPDQETVTMWIEETLQIAKQELSSVGKKIINFKLIKKII